MSKQVDLLDREGTLPRSCRRLCHSARRAGGSNRGTCLHQRPVAAHHVGKCESWWRHLGDAGEFGSGIAPAAGSSAHRERAGHGEAQPAPAPPAAQGQAGGRRRRPSPSPPRPSRKRSRKLRPSRAHPRSSRRPSRTTARNMERVRPTWLAPRAGGGANGPVNAAGDFGSRFGWYVAIIQRKVSESWYTPEIDPATPEGREAIVTFTLSRDGSPSDIRIATPVAPPRSIPPRYARCSVLIPSVPCPPDTREIASPWRTLLLTHILTISAERFQHQLRT